MKFLSVAVPLAILWCILSFHIPPIAFMDSPLERLYFSLNCAAIASFFCLLMGVEAVAHDRLFSPAINPLVGGVESKRIKVNKQYLQNTLEQTLLFVIAILSFSSTCKNGDDMRLILASSVVWILSRFIFWIAYHRNPLDRIYGLSGMLLTMLILGYSVFNFVFHTFGSITATLAGVLFVSIEVMLTYYSWKASQIIPK